MGKTKLINDRYWHDSYYLDMTLEESHLFLYLLTNPHSGILGIYEIDHRTIAYESKLGDKTTAILEKFAKDGKVFYTAGHIIIKNYYKYTAFNAPNLKGHVIQFLDSLPKEIITTHADIITTLRELASPQRLANPKPTSSQRLANNSVNRSQGVTKNQVNPCQAKGSSEHESPKASYSYSYSSSNTLTDSSSIPFPSEPNPDPANGSPNPGGQAEVNGMEGKELEKESVSPPAGSELQYVDGLYMTAQEQLDFIDQYGDALFCEMPARCAEWAKSKGLDVRNGNKLLLSFTETHLDRQKRKRGNNG